MTNTKDIIIELKRVREEKQLSYSDIIKMMEDNGDIPVSATTLSRIFKEGSEDGYFSYETTLRPLAKALLDMETIEESDTTDIKAMKEILKYKIQRIQDLEKQVNELEQALDKEKIRRHEQLDKQREQSQITIDFLKNELALKNKRMDIQNDRTNSLLDRIEKKDDRIEQLTTELFAMKDLKEAYQHCPYKKESE